MKRLRGPALITISVAIMLAIVGCKMLWRPPINNEYAIQETRDRYSLESAGVFRGSPERGEGFSIPIGIVESGIDTSPYPPRGEGPFFLCTIASKDDRRIKPGMYTHNPDDDSFIPGTFSFADFYAEYRMDDFKPIIGTLYYDCVGGTVNVYAYSDTEMHITWALEVEEFEDTGGEPLPTGRSSVVDGHYKGEYAFYDVPAPNDHKGYRIDGDFFPLRSAAMFLGKDADGTYVISIRFGGPDAVTWTWPMSGFDSYIAFNLVMNTADSLKVNRYEFVEGGTETGVCNGFLAFEESDFSEFRPVDGSRVFIPTGGYCEIGKITDDFIDMTWVIEVDEFIYDEDLTATGNSSVLTGTYCGEFTFWDFNLPAGK